MITTKLGLLLGLDGAAVALALGPLDLGIQRMVLLGLCFATAEIAMTLAGAAVGTSAAVGVAGYADLAYTAVLIMLAVAVAGVVLVRGAPAALVGSPPALLGLAVLLGLDNLVAGAGLAATGVSFVAILLAGALSGSLAFACCAAGRQATRVLPQPWRAVASVAMLGALIVATAG
jgi:hypothetical protein